MRYLSNASKYLSLKILGKKTMYKAPIDMRKIANMSFGGIKHTILSAKRNGKFYM